MSDKSITQRCTLQGKELYAGRLARTVREYEGTRESLAS